jgi:hypothetical protein
MPYDQEADRELVQQAFSREWAEPVTAIHVRQFTPRFWVRGRAADGSPGSQHRVRRLFRFLINAGYLIVAIAAELITNVSPAFDYPDKTYRGRVRGGEGSSAVQFADSVRGGDFWLVRSASRLAAAKTGSPAPVMVLWSAAGSQRPQLERNKLRWPDGSSAAFWLDTEESQRLVPV